MKKIYKQLLPKDREVEATQVKIEGNQLIIEVEFEEQFRPKDGDFVVDEHGDVFIVCAKESTSFSQGAYVAFDHKHKEWLFDMWNYTTAVRYAKIEEIQDFLDHLEIELGKRWNPETKQLEDTSKATADIPREKVFKLKDGYMIIPFNVEIARDIQEGRREGYICTRKQHLPVRVICWDSKCPDDYPTPSPIVALVMWYGLESPGCYQENGYWGKKEGKNDLVLAVPECKK